MAGHTPGPWHISDRTDGGAPIIIGAPGWRPGVREIAKVLYWPGSEDPEVHANTNLILAAPDLLAALVAIEEGCSFPEDDVQRAVRDRARAAIAKATEGSAQPLQEAG